jgi:hypothetical protein
MNDNEASSAPSAQQRRAVQQLRATADQLQAMAAKSGGQYGPAAQQAAERLNSAASWIEQREPADMVREAREFARRRPAVVLAGTVTAVIAIRRHPGMVLAGVAAAGLAASRMARRATTAHPASQPDPGSAQPDEPAAAISAPPDPAASDPAIPAPPDPAWTPMPEHPETPSAATGSAPYYPAGGVPGPGATGPAGPEPHGPEPYESEEQR